MHGSNGPEFVCRFFLALALIPSVLQPVVADARPRITRQDELPRHTYEIPGTVSELLDSEEQFADLARAIRRDLLADMQAYDIVDKTTLQGFHHLLMMLDVLEGDLDGASSHLRQVRELEEKPAAKLLTGLAIEARIEAVRSVGGTEPSEALRAAFKREYAARVDALPWDLVQDGLQGLKGQLEMINENLIRGQVKAQFDPAVENAGGLSGQLVPPLVGVYWLLHGGLALKEEALDVLRDVVDRNKTEKPDIWPARSVDLEGQQGLGPVLIAVWDTGVDLDVFSDRLYTNAAEILDGKDNDGNGFVDDRHGIAYDKEWRRIPGLLYPMDEATRGARELQGMFKGYFDLQSAVDSEEATVFRQQIGGLQQDEVKTFLEDFGHYTLHCHGTHVAGIVTAGNPAARVLTARLTADLRPIPDPPTMEVERRRAKEYRDVIDYFKQAGVRVVNMSWVVPRSETEHELLVNGLGKDAAERKAMARELFDVGKRAMFEAMQGAGEILFVVSAGNADNDVGFDESYPPMFDLPNLLIAGAVDQAGDATFFTSFGETVNVYANGFEVDSFVPGGDRMKLSGTSMASPNVANLAAKLFALEPRLTPARVVKLILEGAEVRTEGGNVLRIIHPANSVALLRKHQAMRKAAAGPTGHD